MSLLIVQRKLAAAGFDPGPLDGVWGKRTELALDTALAKAKGNLVASKPTSPVEEVSAIIVAGLALLPTGMDTAPARVIMRAICGQEADFRHRWQVFDAKRPQAMGAARGLWQFERGGGVRGVLTHPSSKTHAVAVCQARNVPPTVDAVYAALHADDVLAAAFARLLLWTDPGALPPVGDVNGAWALYLRTWRPGAWDRGTTAQRENLRRKWGEYYAQAQKAEK